MQVSRTNPQGPLYCEVKPKKSYREEQAEIQALLSTMSFKRKRENDSPEHVKKEFKVKKASIENRSDSNQKKIQSIVERSDAFETARDCHKRKRVEDTSNRQQNRAEPKRVRSENSHQCRQSSQSQSQTTVVQKKQRSNLAYAPNKRKTETKVQKLRKQFLKNHTPRFSNQVPAPKQAPAPKEDIPQRRTGSEQLGSRLSRPLKPITPREVATSKTVSKTAYKAKKHFWTPEEDRKLLAGYQKYGNQWALINEEYDLKLSGDKLYCRYWRRINPQLKKGPWTQEERELLIAGIEKYGLCNWKKISKKILKNTRSDEACLIEYDQVLDPSIRHDAWTKEEDKKMISLRAQNTHWSKIAMEIPGRSRQQLRQRYIITLLPLLQRQNLALQIETKLEKNNL